MSEIQRKINKCTDSQIDSLLKISELVKVRIDRIVLRLDEIGSRLDALEARPQPVLIEGEGP